METNAVFGLFDQMHKQLHARQPSEVMRLNAAIAAGQPFQASPRLAAILREARALSMASGGLFDPGISHLVKRRSIRRQAAACCRGDRDMAPTSA
nr:FAD:protein FMN transferase [uncultured Pseudogulbenkiania sp.]